MGYRGYNFDALLVLKDAGALSASAPAQVKGQPQILDLGAARFEGVMVTQVVALSTANGNETYVLALQGSNDPTFATGVEDIVRVPITAVGRVETPFVNRKYELTYRYLREYVTVGGTGPSINTNSYIGVIDMG